MVEDLLHDIARIRRVLNDAAKDHDNGKDIGSALESISKDLGHLLEKTEARQEELEGSAFDDRTRFVSELAAGFLESMMTTQGSAVTESQVAQAVEMAFGITRRVQEGL